jgi:hypothetical protein
MGRPPIGKVAMTGAERTRLYRLKHAADKPVTKVTKPADPDAAALKKELAQARARLAEAEQQRDAALADKAILHKRLVDGHAVIAEAKAILAAKAIVPADVWKTVLHSAHPDRTTDLKWKLRYEKAFQFLKEHERMLAKKPPPPRTDLPRTVEELVAMKWQVKEERKAKRAAKRAAKANPPKSLDHLDSRGQLRVVGVDPSNLSEAEIAEGAELMRRISQCDRVPGAAKRRPKAVADFQAWRARAEARSPAGDRSDFALFAEAANPFLIDACKALDKPGRKQEVHDGVTLILSLLSQLVRAWPGYTPEQREYIAKHGLKPGYGACAESRALNFRLNNPGWPE